MTSEPKRSVIHWRLHLASPPALVHRMLATDDGRARFWAESAIEAGGQIDFRFVNGMRWRGRIMESDPPHRFAVEYFGGSIASFKVEDDGQGGTDLTLTDAGVPEPDWIETNAGWVSTLLTLKAAVDFGVDLRNHDSRRTWDQGFADN